MPVRAWRASAAASKASQLAVAPPEAGMLQGGEPSSTDPPSSQAATETIVHCHKSELTHACKLPKAGFPIQTQDPRPESAPNLLEPQISWSLDCRIEATAASTVLQSHPQSPKPQSFQVRAPDTTQGFGGLGLGFTWDVGRKGLV